jgi:hypothetical protein
MRKTITPPNYQDLLGALIGTLRGIRQRPDCTEDWEVNTAELIALAQQRDMRAFLTLPPLLRAIFANASPMAKTALEFLASRPDWRERWLPALREDVFGMPPPSPNLPTSSDHLILHTYHAALFESATGTRIDDFDAIIEFGGGYGSFCRLTDRLGFDGRYVVFDMPAFSALQTFYLSALGFRLADGLPALDRGEILCTSDFGLVPAILDHPGFRGRRVLFVATWSLSEAPLAVRPPVEPLIAASSGLLFAYQEAHQGIDNVAYVTDLIRRTPGKAWKTTPALVPGSHYLFFTA